MNCRQLNARPRSNIKMAFTWCRRQHLDILWTLERRHVSWKVDSIQKSGLSKRYVDSKNSAVGDSI